ncbi:MAG: hypothetical protein HYX25_08760 [Candidatus Solibacter usitatus]|nr:hypothetical protein [Candidatus Solibacter usitatus]
MSSGDSARAGPLAWHRGLAGLQAGTVGVLVLLGYLMADAVWRRQSVWRVPNLLAAALSDDARVRASFSARTVSGVALAIVIYGTLGALVAVATPQRLSRGSALLIGLLAAAAWLAFSSAFLWGQALGSSGRALWVAHLLYGGILSLRLPGGFGGGRLP